MKYGYLMAACAIGSLTLAQPAQAQSDDAKDVGLLTFFGLSAAKGETTVGDKAGELEAYILASNMVADAGKDIRDAIDVSGIVVPLAKEQKLDFQSYYIAERRVSNLERALDTYLPPRNQCRFPRGAGNGNALIDTNTIPSDILNSVKTDQAISTIIVDPSAQMIINAVVANNADNVSWRLPNEIGVNSGNSKLYDRINDVVKYAAPYARGKCAKKPGIKTHAAAITTAAKALLAPGDKGAVSLLEKAMLLEGLLDTANPAQKIYTLRINVEKAGGTLINKSNIWTTLGFNGVTMSGGMIITYRLVDASNGEPKKSGTLICHTNVRGLKEINRAGTNNRGKCTEVTPG